MNPEAHNLSLIVFKVVSLPVPDGMEIYGTYDESVISTSSRIIIILLLLFYYFYYYLMLFKNGSSSGHLRTCFSRGRSTIKQYNINSIIQYKYKLQACIYNKSCRRIMIKNRLEFLASNSQTFSL